MTDYEAIERDLRGRAAICGPTGTGSAWREAADALVSLRVELAEAQKRIDNLLVEQFESEQVRARISAALAVPLLKDPLKTIGRMRVAMRPDPSD